MAEGTSLLRMHTAYTCIVGSNPTVSASIRKKAPAKELFFRLLIGETAFLLSSPGQPKTTRASVTRGVRRGVEIPAAEGRRPPVLPVDDRYFRSCLRNAPRSRRRYYRHDGDGEKVRLMPLNLNKLTAVGILRLKEPGYYGDGGGLVLQVSRSGAKSWLFRYTRGGKKHEMGLGSIRTVDLASAREAARQCRQLLQDNRDPLEERRGEKICAALERGRRMTFNQCAAAYIEAHRGGWKNAKHADQWRNTLETYASPLIGELPVAVIDTDLIVKVLSPINVGAGCAGRQ